MKFLTQHKGFIAVSVFLIVMIVSGMWLVSSGNWENPLSAFRMFNQGSMPEGERSGPPEGFQMGEEGSESGEQAMPQGGGRGGNQDSINWDQFGQVLYNVWFLFAAGGVVMIVGSAIGAIRKQFRQRSRSVNAIPAS